MHMDDNLSVPPDLPVPTAELPGNIFPVVGVGASAGGLEAIVAFLQEFPAQPDLSVVVVQHLDPKRSSQLAEILQKSSAMPVIELISEMPLRANAVYVTPSHADIELSKGRLLLKPRFERELGVHQPIDTLFISLAKNYSQHCIGVILSGTGNDGTAGIQSIKAEQGLVFAQDQASAKFGQMPEAAVASGFVDAILPPQEIARRILDYCHGLRTLSMPGDSLELNDQGTTLDDYGNFDKILAILKSSYRIDFKLYKLSTIKRRMLRRMLLRERKTFLEYLTLVEQDPLELQALYDDMLINVTTFFRDPEVFESLRTSIFPDLIRSKASGEALRLWITGCSSGEEVYSLIICLLETMESLNIHRPIQAFATDISDRAIDKARRGVYTVTQMQGLSEERIELYFKKFNEDYQINKSIRELCVFAVQNVTGDPPFSRIDLISCRNLMIYLSPALQKKVLPTFHYALNQKGILLLGLSENVGEFGADLFNCIDKKYKIFTKIELKTKVFMSFSGDLTANRSKQETSSNAPPSEFDQNHELRREAEQIALRKYSPSGVVIRDNFDIVSSLGDTSPYLVLPAGSASLNIFKMARDGLVHFIRQTLQKAKDTGLNASSHVLWRGRNTDDLALTIDVFHMKPSASGQLFYLVLFSQESPLRGSPQLFRPSHWFERIATSLFSSQDPKIIIANLKTELSTANQNLRVLEDQLQQTLAEHQLTSEELKAASEEILSSNEELQSTNEELETSKEELQSTVEELNTVNEQLRSINNELAVVNADLLNLLNSSNIAIIIVSRDLHIRRFTPASELLFHLITADQGRPLSDINLHLRDVTLPPIVEQVIGDLRPRELEVQAQDDRWFSLRVKPYRSLDDRIDGAVISFVDIDHIVRSRNFAKAIVNTVMEPLLILNRKFHVISANQAFYREFALLPAEVEGRLIFDLDDGHWNQAKLRYFLKKILPQQQSFKGYELPFMVKSGALHQLSLSASPINSSQDHLDMILLAIDDVTEQKRAEDSQRKWAMIFEKSALAIAVCDKDHLLIEQANDAFGAILACKSSELIGRPIRQLFTPQSPPLAEEFWRQALKQQSVESEAEFQRSDHSIVPVSVKIENIIGENGKVLAHLIHVIDITEKRHNEQREKDIRTQLEAASLAKSNFVANISHEIRTPLTAILSYTETLAKFDVNDSRRLEWIEGIRRNIADVTEIIDEVLDLSKVEAGKISIHVTRFNLKRLMDEVLILFQIQAQDKGIQLRLETAIDLPLSLFCDRMRLRQILINIIGNALKFTKEGEILIQLLLGSSLSPPQEGKLAFLIKDSGIGISPTQQLNLFQAFSQAESSITRRYGGTGLGLALSRSLAQLLGGDLVLLESSLGQGSSFLLTIDPGPLGATDLGAGEKSSRSLPQLPSSYESADQVLKGYRILVVDDAKDLQMLFSFVMESQGALVVKASNGEEAVRLAQAGNFDVILMDLQMPVMDGYEATRRLREGGYEQAIIALTAHAMLDERHKVFHAGFTDYLTKPVSVQQLISTVRNYPKSSGENV